MSGPTPDSELEGHCSTIHDGTLYVLSPDSFQSLPLEKNATWSKEATGQAVTSPACVDSGDAFYVVGGTSDDTSYGGLQRYHYSNKTWESLHPPVGVMQNRANHSAAYLSDSSGILVYAGSQPSAPSYLSSQTFLIHLEPPYNIEAFTSQAPATNLPILEPWNSSHAVMVGGNQWNNKVYTFDATSGWVHYATSLPGPVNPASRGTIIDGDDGSKVLQVVEFNVSPNNVTNYVLQGADGQPAAVGQTVGGTTGSSKKRKRDLTLDNWPAYNSTNAPTSTRTDCSVSSNSDGLSVIAGGSTDDPIALFDQSQNSWIDTDQFFGEKEQQPLQPSSTLPTIVTPTASSPSSQSSTASSSSGGGSSHDRMMRTLGITLGVILGVAAVFVLILLFMRWRKMKKRKEEGYVDEKNSEGKDRMSFQDRGASFMKEAGGSVNDLLQAPPKPNRYEQGMNGSHSSLAIIAGKFGTGSKRNSANNNNNNMPKTSYESTADLVKNKDGDAVEMQSIGDKSTRSTRTSLSRTSMSRKSSARATEHPLHLMPPIGNAFAEHQNAAGDDKSIHRNRSSGWSKYFATSQPTGLSHLPTAYTKPHSGDASEWPEPVPTRPSRIPSSQLVGPLDIDFTKSLDGQRLSKVATGSPSFNDSREDLAKSGGRANAHNGQKGVIENAVHRQSNASSAYDRSTMSSARTTDFFSSQAQHTPWTPASPTFKDHVNHSRPTSSLYTASIAEQRIPSRGKNSGFFPGAGTTYRPPPKSKFSAGPSTDWVSPKKVEVVSPPKPLEEVDEPQDRDSTITVFPRGVSSAYYAGREKEQSATAGAKKPMTEDMSWLNINQA